MKLAVLSSVTDVKTFVLRHSHFQKTQNNTHTHTHIYIYIYIYIERERERETEREGGRETVLHRLYQNSDVIYE
jgi:hypothetical protein